MKIKYLIIGLITLCCFVAACNKDVFLDKKPASNIVSPLTLTDFQYLLDNTAVMNYNGALSQLSSDEYTVSYADWQTGTATERNAYIWSADIYAGDVNVLSWNNLYTEVFYANSVLDGLQKSDSLSTAQGQFIKGWALFDRAYAFYDLTRNFCKAYNAGTANTDLGIPLRLTAGIDQVIQRSTLQQTFDQILSDLTQAASLLPVSKQVNNPNRPSKLAAYALLARISLDMRDYIAAENYVDQSLTIYSTLIDYNTLSTTATAPFTTTNDELIYTAAQIATYTLFTPSSSVSRGKIPANIIALYGTGDLRLPIFFGIAADGTYYRKRGYLGTGNYSFTGLATDEMYLIKAECLARRNQVTASMDQLNKLLIKRYKSANFLAATASNSSTALSLILTERAKEMIWRGTRWSDLKRLNAEGANITLSRVLNGITYTLPPNDNRWVMPIPSDEIALSGIAPNIR